MRRLEPLLLALLLVAALVPYANTLGNGFAFDDRGIIVENPIVRDASTPLRSFFTEPYYPGALYRPLTHYTYWLNAQAGGELQPFGFHLVNFGLHAAVTILVFALCLALRLDAAVSFLAALLFAVHPIHTEAVANVVGRAELLCAAAVLGSLLCITLWRDGRAAESPRRRGWLLPAAAGLFATGLLCKESAFVLLPLLFVTDWLRSPRPLAALVRSPARSGELAVFGGIAAAYLALRWTLFGTLTVGEPISLLDNPLAHTSAAVRIGTALVVLSDSLAQMILPLRLSADYSFDQIPLVESAADPRLWTSGAVLLLLAVLVWRLRRSEPGVAGGALFFLAALSLTSNILFPIGTIRGERLLYLPSVGLCIAAAVGAAAALRQRTALAAAAIALATLALAGRTYARNSDWASELTLFTATVESSPYSSKAHHNLAVALSRAKRDEESTLAFRRALQIYPDYDEAAFGIGCAYQARGLMAGALHWYDEALRIDPKHMKAQLNRGVIFYNDGNFGDAEQAFRAGLELHPDEPRLLTGIGLVRLAEGRVDEALAILEKALRIAPGDPETRRAIELALQQPNHPTNGS